MSQGEEEPNLEWRAACHGCGVSHPYGPGSRRSRGGVGEEGARRRVAGSGRRPGEEKAMSGLSLGTRTPTGPKAKVPKGSSGKSPKRPTDQTSKTGSGDWRGTKSVHRAGDPSLGFPTQERSGIRWPPPYRLRPGIIRPRRRPSPPSELPRVWPVGFGPKFASPRARRSRAPGSRRAASPREGESFSVPGACSRGRAFPGEAEGHLFGGPPRSVADRDQSLRPASRSAASLRRAVSWTRAKRR